MAGAKLKQSNLERYPSWVDLLILAAAFAVAIGITWLGPHGLEDLLGLPKTEYVAPFTLAEMEAKRDAEAKAQGSDSITVSAKWALRAVLSFGTPVLVLLAPGLLLASYRSPRMFRRRSHRGVGVLTTTITGIMVPVYLLNEYALRRLQPVLRGYSDNPLPDIWREIADQISVVILAMWIVLALGRRWHAEPHWRDRLGRLMGFGWVGYWVLDGVFSPLWLTW